MPQPQIWPRKQEVSQQQTLTGPALMKEVKRTNTVIVYPNQRAKFTLHNIYAMDVDWENRNCYSCRGFSYLARNCRNRGIENKIGKSRRMEYRQRLRIKESNRQDNLNRKGDLVVLD